MIAADGTDVPADGGTVGQFVEHVRGRLARCTAPKSVVFGPLPKTSTGKIQTYVLRDRAWGRTSRRIN